MTRLNGWRRGRRDRLRVLFSLRVLFLFVFPRPSPPWVINVLIISSTQRKGGGGGLLFKGTADGLVPGLTGFPSPKANIPEATIGLKKKGPQHQSPPSPPPPPPSPYHPKRPVFCNVDPFRGPPSGLASEHRCASDPSSLNLALNFMQGRAFRAIGLEAYPHDISLASNATS